MNGLIEIFTVNLFKDLDSWTILKCHSVVIFSYLSFRLHKERNELTSGLMSLYYQAPWSFFDFKVNVFIHQKDLFHSLFTPH